MLKHTIGNKAVYEIEFEVNYGQMKSINCFLYKSENKLTLIDGGINIPAFHTFFDKKLAEYGFTIQDIDQIILTHYHGDHIGVVNRIYEQKAMPIFAHCIGIERLHLEPQYLQRKYMFYKKLYIEYEGYLLGKNRLEKIKQSIESTDTAKINAPIQPLVEGQIIEGLRVIETPGHSPDSISLFDEETKWLFVGDTVLYTGTTNALVDHDCEGEMLSTVSQQKQSLEQLQQKQTSRVFAGHQASYENLFEITEKNLQRIEFKVNRLVDQVKSGHNTVLQIAMSIYGERLEKEFTLIISDIIGYMLYAEELGLISKEWENNRWILKSV